MGAIINAITIVIASFIGLFLNKNIPERVSVAIMNGIGLCILIMGIDGALATTNISIMIISITIGTLVGEAIDLDAGLTRFATRLEKAVVKDTSQTSLSGGFISATLIFCVGSMAILGSLENGLYGDPTTLFVKSLLDGITAIFLASSLGAGVLLSAGAVLVYEGAIILLAQFLAPLLSAAVITEVVAVGSLLLVALGLNFINVTEMKIMNMLPAMVFPIILVPLFNLF